MNKTSIILDVDTGVDDAFAVLFAAMHPGINLLGITCVDGNTNVDQVVANTLKVLDAAGANEIPVARGAVRPLLGESQYAEYVHGADGMGDLEIAPSHRRVDPRSAVCTAYKHRTLLESFSRDGQKNSSNSFNGWFSICRQCNCCR